MKKRKIIILCMIISAFILSCGYKCKYDDEQKKVYDSAGIFTSEEIQNLENECRQAAKDTKLDFIILTTDDAKGKSTQSFAEDFYDSRDFGYDQGYSGITLCIDMDNREVNIVTSGIAIRYFDDEKIDDILDEMDAYMKSSYYYYASHSFITQAMQRVSDENNDNGEIYQKWFNGNFKDYKEFDKKYGNRGILGLLRNPIVCLVLAVGIGAVTVLLMSLRRKSTMAADGNTYMGSNELRFNKRSDMYLRTTVVKRKIESKSGGGSGHGGSFHSGSSGRSHGGGGHSF